MIHSATPRHLSTTASHATSPVGLVPAVQSIAGRPARHAMPTGSFGPSRELPVLLASRAVRPVRPPPPPPVSPANMDISTIVSLPLAEPAAPTATIPMSPMPTAIPAILPASIVSGYSGPATTVSHVRPATTSTISFVRLLVPSVCMDTKEDASPAAP